MNDVRTLPFPPAETEMPDNRAAWEGALEEWQDLRDVVRAHIASGRTARHASLSRLRAECLRVLGLLGAGERVAVRDGPAADLARLLSRLEGDIGSYLQRAGWAMPDETPSSNTDSSGTEATVLDFPTGGRSGDFQQGVDGRVFG